MDALFSQRAAMDWLNIQGAGGADAPPATWS
jgi:hypothetical protein